MRRAKMLKPRCAYLHTLAKSNVVKLLTAFIFRGNIIFLILSRPQPALAETCNTGGGRGMSQDAGVKKPDQLRTLAKSDMVKVLRFLILGRSSAFHHNICCVLRVCAFGLRRKYITPEPNLYRSKYQRQETAAERPKPRCPRETPR